MKNSSVFNTEEMFPANAHREEDSVNANGVPSSLSAIPNMMPPPPTEMPIESFDNDLDLPESLEGVDLAPAPILPPGIAPEEGL